MKLWLLALYYLYYEKFNPGGHMPPQTPLVAPCPTKYPFVICRAETFRNVTNEPFSKRKKIRIFVRFDE